MKQYVFAGPHALQKLVEIIAYFSPRIILLVRGKRSYVQCGGDEAMKEILAGYSGCVTEFSDFSENPKLEDVERGLALVKGLCPDLIIGIGGGSVMDMSKLIRFFNSYIPDPEFQHFDKQRELIPLIVLPTTAGTGSESTHFAVLYRNKIKYSVAHANILADCVVADPCFTYKNPVYLTASSGFDALAQAIEAYWNAYATIESDEYAIKAIKLLWPNLPEVVAAPTVLLRNKVAEGSFWAGKAINITKTTAPHALSYPFTSYYDLPHGHAVAVSFSFFLKYNYPDEDKVLHKNLRFVHFKKKMDKLYQMLGVNDPEDAFYRMTNYISKLSLDFKCPEGFDPLMILNNINLQRLSNNPVVLEHADLCYFVNSLKVIK